MFALNLKLQQKHLEFIWSYSLPKIRGLCESFEINAIGNKAEMLRCLSLCVVEKDANFYRNVIDELIIEHDKSDDNNVV